MADTDFYPGSIPELPTWHGNLAANIAPLAAKYNLTLAQVAAITADNAFIQFWVPMRNSAEIFVKALRKFFNEIAGNDPSLDPPAALDFEIGTPPTQVPPGIEFRAREIARQIKGHSSYSVADGELLGIVGGSSEGLSPDEVKPTIVVTTTASGYGYSVEISGRAKSDMWQVLAQNVGGTGWNVAATASGKSIDLVYAPTAAESGKPVQLQVRVQLRKSNANYGQPSDIVQVTVNP